MAFSDYVCLISPRHCCFLNCSHRLVSHICGNPQAVGYINCPNYLKSNQASTLNPFPAVGMGKESCVFQWTHRFYLDTWMPTVLTQCPLPTNENKATDGCRQCAWTPEGVVPPSLLYLPLILHGHAATKILGRHTAFSHCLTSPTTCNPPFASPFPTSAMPH